MAKEKLMLKIGDMTCASCAANIEKALRKAKGVTSANVNFATERAAVELDPELTSIEALEKVIDETGYKVVKEQEADVRQARRRMVSGLGLAIPLMLIMLLNLFFKLRIPGYNLILLILAFPVVFCVGYPTLRGAARALSHFSANMDVLISMGALAAYLTGPAALIFPVSSFAGVSAMIMAFHLIGRFLEARAKGRASQAIKKLLKLEARSARILVDGKEKEVPISEVRVGDLMIVRPGEKIPTDGLVVDGHGAIDESMATGESMPVQKKKNSHVIGATINQYGALKVEATKVGEDTFLSQVIKMVEECQGSKVPIQELADKITGYFVPAVLATALLTLVAWLLFPNFFINIILSCERFIPWVNPELGTVSLAIYAAVAVLVIACPCALSLATPTALMVGSGIGAENGILIRHGEAIQSLKEIHTIVFDKTGTITRGRPAVTDITAIEGLSEDEVLKFAASLEESSEHPLARAVVEKAKEKEIRLDQTEGFQAIPGCGVKGTVSGKQVLVGNKKLMEDLGIDFSLLKLSLERLENEAKTTMLVAVEKKTVGIIAVADTLKEDSAKAIASLKKMGLETAMLTGDNERTAKAIAKKVGIDRVLADVLPDEKVSALKRLQGKVGKVAMVGDGINDSPALTQADVGIAIGTGTDIAIESSDVILIQGNLSAVVTAVRLSRATFRKIEQNLFWAFFYNCAAVPIAIFGLLHPAIATCAMTLSSLNVITNSLRLRKNMVTHT